MLNGIVSITEEGSSLNNTAASLNSLVASGNHIVAEIESKGIDVGQAPNWQLWCPHLRFHLPVGICMLAQFQVMHILSNVRTQRWNRSHHCNHVTCANMLQLMTDNESVDDAEHSESSE